MKKKTCHQKKTGLIYESNSNNYFLSVFNVVCFVFLFGGSWKYENADLIDLVLISQVLFS